MKKEKRKSAFTLAELMVVIAIIAILATVSILGYKSFIKRETVNSALTEADQVREVITSQVIASTDGFVQVEYDGGNGTTQFTYDGGVLQIATFPPTYKTFANDYIGTGGKERSDCFDSAMRQKFPSLAGVPGLLTIDGSDIWYHHVGYQELYEYITKNGLQDIDFEPSEPFFKGDVAVNIMSMEYKTIDDSGVGDDPTDTPYKLSIDKYEVFVPLNGTETINFTVTPPTADIVKNGGEGIFTVSETRNSVGVGTFTLHGVQPGTSYLTLSVGNVHRAIKVNVGESGKHIIRAPIQNSSIPWDKESHFPKDTDWIYWGDYTYVIDGKNVKASEIFEIDESTRIPHSELGAYKVKFQFKEAYKSTCCWSTTFKSDPIEVTWKIAKRSLSIPKQSNILEYKPMSQGHISIFNGLGDNIRTLIGNMGITGEIQEPEWSGLVIKDENGADYDLVEHGIVKWSLKRDNDDIYQGIIKFLDDTNKPREHIGYSEPGIYMDAIFEIQPEYTDFYCWMDEQGKALNNPSVTVSWQIHKILIPDPTMPEELKYTAKNPPSTNRNDYFSGDGLEKAKDAGVTVNVYTKENLPDEYKKDYKDKNIIVFKVSDSQLDHYGFRSNEKAGVLIYKYTIEKESIPVPVFTGTKANYTYNNQQKSVRFGREEKHWMLTTYYDYFSDFDLDAETWYDVVEIVDEDSNGNKSVSSAKDAGTYSVIFKIKEPAYYKWDDSSSINKAYGTNNEYIKVNWEIYKIQQPSVTIANITLTDKKTGTTGVSGLKENAAITSVTSSSANFKVSFLGTTITVEALQDRQDNNDRTATITVNYGETTTYAAGSKTFTVTQKAKDAQSVKIENISLGSSTSGTTTVTGLKENAAITSVSSSNTSDFSASYSGTTITVKALKARLDDNDRSATITVTYGSTDNYKGGTTTFTVTQKAKPTQNVTINDVTIDGGKGETRQTTVVFSKENATISKVESSNTSNFSASYSGTTITVTALKDRPGQFSSDRSATITVTYDSTDNYKGGTTTFTVTQTASCVTGDTLVTLADGSTKRIDELTYDDDVIVWDFFNGEYISCKPFTIFHHQDADSYIKLEFEDGNILKIVGSHKLFDVNTNKWEEIDEINCKDYIGQKFVELVNGNNKYVKLVSVEVINEQVTSYSVMTAPHINVVLANMLTFTPQRYDGLYEFFEVGENLTYDQDAMKSDIEKYGLYDSSAFEPYGLSKEAFDYVGGQYFKIFEGRGVITFDQTIGLINDYVFGRDVDDIVPR